MNRNQKWYQENKETRKEHYQEINGGTGVQMIRRIAKEECRKLANYKCAICGGEGLDAHHIIPVTEENSTDTQDNLICLCRSCHERVHNNIYVINNDKSIEVNYDYISKDRIEDKPEYIKYYEQLHGIEVYKANGYGYYYFNGLKKIRLTAVELKKEWLENIATLKDNKIKLRMIKLKSAYIRDYYKTKDKSLWHYWARISRQKEFTMDDRYTIDLVLKLINEDWTVNEKR